MVVNYLGYNMPNMSEYPLVEIIWVDAEEYGEVGWNELKNVKRYAKKPCPIMHTVGYVIHRTDTHISLISTVGDKECSTLEKIPISFVKDIIKLERVPEKKTNAKL